MGFFSNLFAGAKKDDAQQMPQPTETCPSVEAAAATETLGETTAQAESVVETTPETPAASETPEVAEDSGEEEKMSA